MQLPSFAVIIPMFNEESGAEICIRAVCSELDRIPNRTVLIIVDDGSTDKTGQILSEMTPGWPLLKVASHTVNRGYGAALRTGIETAAKYKVEYALFMDSDLTNHPADISRFAECMCGGFDVIKATRYSHGGKVHGVPFYRLAISAVGNRLATLLFGLPLHDCTNGFRAVRVPLLLQMKLVENRFPVIMEELYWLKYMTKSFTELPVTLTDRAEGQRPTAFVYKPSVFYSYLKYPLRAFLGIRPSRNQMSGSQGEMK